MFYSTFIVEIDETFNFEIFSTLRNSSNQISYNEGEKELYDLEYILKKTIQKRHKVILKTLETEFINRKWMKTNELISLLSIASYRIGVMRQNNLIVGELHGGSYYYTMQSIKELIEKYQV